MERILIFNIKPFIFVVKIFLNLKIILAVVFNLISQDNGTYILNLKRTIFI